MSEWVNCGDVNFVEYGGAYVKAEGGSEYTVLLVATPWNAETVPEGHVAAALLYVDVDDNWIDEDEVSDFSGVDKSDGERYADAVVGYYGGHEFQPTGYDGRRLWIESDSIITADELRDWMGELGIEE